MTPEQAAQINEQLANWPVDTEPGPASESVQGQTWAAVDGNDDYSTAPAGPSGLA